MAWRASALSALLHRSFHLELGVALAGGSPVRTREGTCPGD